MNFLLLLVACTSQPTQSQRPPPLDTADTAAPVTYTTATPGSLADARAEPVVCWLADGTGWPNLQLRIQALGLPQGILAEAGTVAVPYNAGGPYALTRIDNRLVASVSYTDPRVMQDRWAHVAFDPATTRFSVLPSLPYEDIHRAGTWLVATPRSPRGPAWQTFVDPLALARRQPSASVPGRYIQLGGGDEVLLELFSNGLVIERDPITGAEDRLILLQGWNTWLDAAAQAADRLYTVSSFGGAALTGTMSARIGVFDRATGANVDNVVLPPSQLYGIWCDAP